MPKRTLRLGAGIVASLVRRLCVTRLVTAHLAVLPGLVSACAVVPNPDYGDDAADETASVGEPSSSGVHEGAATDDRRETDTGHNGSTTNGAHGSADGTGPENATSESGDEGMDDACGDDEQESEGPCPPECDARVGMFSCSAAESCGQTTLACPPGRSCQVVCDAREACEEAVVTCSPANPCAVECDAKVACKGIDVRCGAGTCVLECEPKTCDDARLRCGTSDSSIRCAGPPRDVNVEAYPLSTWACAAERSCESGCLPAVGSAGRDRARCSDFRTRPPRSRRVDVLSDDA